MPGAGGRVRLVLAKLMNVCRSERPIREFRHFRQNRLIEWLRTNAGAATSRV